MIGYINHMASSVEGDWLLCLIFMFDMQMNDLYTNVSYNTWKLFLIAD